LNYKKVTIKPQIPMFVEVYPNPK